MVEENKQTKAWYKSKTVQVVAAIVGCGIASVMGIHIPTELFNFLIGTGLLTLRLGDKKLVLRESKE